MSSNRIFVVIAAVIFAALALGSLYRLMVGFPITISGHPIGQTTSFLAFAVCTALCLMLFKSAFSAR